MLKSVLSAMQGGMHRDWKKVKLSLIAFYVTINMENPRETTKQYYYCQQFNKVSEHKEKYKIQLHS